MCAKMCGGTIVWTLQRGSGGPAARRMGTSLVPTHSCGGGRRMGVLAAVVKGARRVTLVTTWFRLGLRDANGMPYRHPAGRASRGRGMRCGIHAARGVYVGRFACRFRWFGPVATNRASSTGQTLAERGPRAAQALPTRWRADRVGRHGGPRPAGSSHGAECGPQDPASGSSAAARARIHPPRRFRAPAVGRSERARPAPCARAAPAPGPPSPRCTPGRSPPPR